MRRAALAAVALVVVLITAPFAQAQSGYVSSWTDPSPNATLNGKPLVYLDQQQKLAGQVSHPNGISHISAVLVPEADPPAEGCEADVDPTVEMGANGDQADFQVTASFPCNLVYELRATAQANPSGGLTSSTPSPHTMPLYVAVAIPPAPVAQVDATLEVDGDDREVTLEWTEGDEPDLLGYVVVRDGETLGQVDAGDPTRYVDDDPPVGATSSYQVIAVRNGPDDEVEQVAAEPTTVEVEVPGDEADADGEGGTTPEEPDPQVAGEATPAEGGAQPDAGGLSSVRARAGQPPSLGPPTTIDTGFQGTLPFQSAQPGEPTELAAPAGDPAVVATFDETDPLDEKQRLSFIAGGLAVLVGAATIFHVTRRAAREAY